jgi:hypothetical protein
MMTIEVYINEGQLHTIIIREGDKPDEIAPEFSRVHSINILIQISIVRRAYSWRTKSWRPLDFLCSKSKRKLNASKTIELMIKLTTCTSSPLVWSTFDDSNSTYSSDRVYLVAHQHAWFFRFFYISKLIQQSINYAVTLFIGAQFIHSSNNSLSSTTLRKQCKDVYNINQENIR